MLHQNFSLRATKDDTDLRQTFLILCIRFLPANNQINKIIIYAFLIDFLRIHNFNNSRWIIFISSIMENTCKPGSISIKKCLQYRISSLFPLEFSLSASDSKCGGEVAEATNQESEHLDLLSFDYTSSFLGFQLSLNRQLYWGLHYCARQQS